MVEFRKNNMKKFISMLVIATSYCLFLAGCASTGTELPKDAKIEYLGECGWGGKKAYVINTHPTSKVKARVEISWYEGEGIKTTQEVFKLFPEQATFVRCTAGNSASGDQFSFRVSSTVQTNKYFY